MLKEGEYTARQMNRHLRWTRFLRLLLVRFFAWSFGYIYEPGRLPEGGNLILANHVTRIDFVLLGSLYDQHIYYVVGENVLRNRILKFFLEHCLGVIGHMRGTSSLNTIRQMNRLLAQNGNVCIFPEGSMTFDGRSGDMGMAIAKMAKRSKANLVLCTIEGGYLTQPRWGTTKRRGQVSVKDYIVSAEELGKMSADEILALINSRLHVDDYERQSASRIEYKGRKLCKGLECCIYECPKCGEITGLKTTNSKLLCKCGFEAEYDKYGYLTEQSGKQYTVAQLCDRQKENLKNRLEAACRSAERVLLFEDEMNCKIISLDKGAQKLGKMRIKVYSDGVEYCTNDKIEKIEFKNIEGVFVVLRNTLNCIIAGRECEYELCGDFSTNALKYRDLYEILKETD